jgi:hypothetical protein
MSDIWDEYEEIVGSDDFNAREKFVLREDLPDSLVQEILDSEGDLGILSSLASNQALSKGFLEGIFRYEFAISEDEDPDYVILRGLAQNPSAGEEILRELAEHDDEEIAEIAQETLEGLE